MKKSNLPIAVIGLGKTGISIAKYLKKNNKIFFLL
jgi:UDP-N-acetylmuramoylalanine-D-glutamate ligase